MLDNSERDVALSKTERVYKYILSRHTRGDYGAGQRLVIAQLAEDLGVSAVPVREALSRLQADGIVEYTHQKGFRTRSADTADIVAALQAHAIIEAAAIGIAAPFINAKAITELRAHNARIAESVNSFDPRGFIDASNGFHDRFLSFCPNNHLVDLLTRGALHATALRAASAVLSPHRATSVVAEHEELLSLIESGAPSEEIESLARAHRLSTAAAYAEARGRR